MAFGSLGGWEWVIILVLVIILFGVGKLPQVGRALGTSIREFREGLVSPKESESGQSTDQSKA